MGETYLVGVDIGTGGTKAGLFNQDGNCVAEAFEVSDLHRPKPGSVEEDPER
ncbi:MAG TPA: FGGY family carbohydrate kinase, partial [Spirochaetia bacterium]|nr:FGGY family carbohydrate kinase [Spirochaetia bacterium]